MDCELKIEEDPLQRAQVEELASILKAEAIIGAAIKHFKAQAFICSDNIVRLSTWIHIRAAANKVKFILEEDRCKENEAVEKIGKMEPIHGIGMPLRGSKVLSHLKNTVAMYRVWTSNELETLRDIVTEKLRQYVKHCVSCGIMDNKADRPMTVEYRQQLELATVQAASLGDLLRMSEVTFQERLPDSLALENIQQEDPTMDTYFRYVKADDTQDGETPTSTSLEVALAPPDRLTKLEFWKQLWRDVSLCLSSMHSVKTPRECQLTFFHHLHPFINRGPWTKEEEANLLSLVSSLGNQQWDRIAEELQTSRTAYSVFEKYQTTLNRDLTTNEWTPQQDADLKTLVTKYENAAAKWRLVAKNMPGKTNTACRARYLQIVGGLSMKQGRWSIREDIKLQLLVALYGRGLWARVASHFDDRTDIKCRERYENVLAPEVDKTEWSEAECQQLLDIVEEIGPGKWAKVQERLPHRTDADCCRQWERLRPFSALLHDSQRAARNHVIPNVFSRRSKALLQDDDLETRIEDQLMSVVQDFCSMEPTQEQEGLMDLEPEEAAAQILKTRKPGSREKKKEDSELQNRVRDVARLQYFLQHLSTGESKSDKHLVQAKQVLLRLKKKELAVPTKSLASAELLPSEKKVIELMAKRGLHFRETVEVCEEITQQMLEESNHDAEEPNQVDEEPHQDDEATPESNEIERPAVKKRRRRSSNK